jgi:1,2-diacylglycerol 3-alpha-glucosyltransferase
MKVVIGFDNLGPYHVARLYALSKLCDLVVLENRAQSREYLWNSYSEVPFRRLILHEDYKENYSATKLWRRIASSLDDMRPDIVVVPGWASNQALAMAQWSHSNAIPTIVMSESQQIDGVRNSAAEALKRAYLRTFAGAIAGGDAHRRYLIKLGMPNNRIRDGYDVVDNSYFSRNADEIRARAAFHRGALGLPERFLLTVARFIPKKNLLYLLSEYEKFISSGCARNVHLVILGEGALRNEMERSIAEKGLGDLVRLPGFIQYDELPAYYALSDGFILASLVEPWGLVVNEAMASGLPVFVSDRCGSANSLVSDGVNGFVFDPSVKGALTRVLNSVVPDRARLADMGAKGKEIIAEWSPDRFARNLIDLAYSVRNVRLGLGQKIVINAIGAIKKVSDLGNKAES